MLRPIGFSALFLLGLAGAAAAQSPKIWRHGVIEPKSDAGFVMMASRRDFGNKFGLKIETLALKNGQIAIKALLAGELDSVESGAGEAIVAGAAGADPISSVATGRDCRTRCS